MGRQSAEDDGLSRSILRASFSNILVILDGGCRENRLETGVSGKMKGAGESSNYLSVKVPVEIYIFSRPRKGEIDHTYKQERV